jgi:hypothetical protein
MRNFVGIDRGLEAAPDETTVCTFRHLLERNELGKVLLKAGERVPAGELHQGLEQQDRGCDHHQRTELDKE